MAKEGTLLRTTLEKGRPMTTAQADPVEFLTRQEIEQKAGQVLQENGLESIPVNLLDLAEKQGIGAFNAKFFDDSLVGLIAKKGDNVTLLVKQSDGPARKRFTIAHELGHYFLHLLSSEGEFVDGEVNLFRVPPEEGGRTEEHRKEAQANMFAAALLMPEEAVRKELKRIRSVKAMARRFNVSVEAMGLRVAQLGLE